MLALAAAMLVGLASADVALLGRHTTAQVVRVQPDQGACAVRWSPEGRATVDCGTPTARPGNPVATVALPWPFPGDTVDTTGTPVAAAVAGGGLGPVGRTGRL
ncbi:hypothetical protein ABH931_003728 [Streptacidiphilus sp. MAP12-33]|uniref:hypothetical protein n=1 Tax=Streptacidiphilus sp. MAP12-33 TaxID=3156266 RepID=UPI003512E2AC